MKKVIKTMMMLFVASTFVLTSCTDDTEVKDVELTMIPAATSGSHFVFDTLTIRLNASGNDDNKLKSIKITKAIAGQPGVITMYENTKLSGTAFIYDLKDTLQPGEAGINTITITLTGEKGNAQTKTYTATVNAIGLIESTGSPVTLFGQAADTASSQIFISLSSFVAYTRSEARNNNNEALKNSIDLAFYYGQNNKHTLASLDDSQMHTVLTSMSSFWTSADPKRVTGLYKANGQINYATVEASGSDKDLLTFANGKTFNKSIPNLAPNDLILFKTNDGKYGLLKIVAADGNTTSSAKLSFDGLVQK